jgi:2-keto-4-pentenoate hydratase/2-oxohepta-3-ene-1,7-dioic acid hydratase in catechol pathway
MSEKIIPGLNLPIKSIYCIGRNYAEHAKELNNPLPSSPMVFLKPQSAICYNNDEIVIPRQSSDVHHEVEVVIAVSKSGKDIPESEALDYIAGIGIGIDFTARDIQQKAKEAGHPWTVAKGFDTFAPISTFISIDKINDIQNINLSLSVNEIVKQSGTTSQMIFKISTLISYLSSIFTLYPGDLIFTGTPSGVSSIKSGDIITATLEQDLTSLTVTVK